MNYSYSPAITLMEEMSTIGPEGACNHTHSYCVMDMKESDVSVSTRL